MPIRKRSGSGYIEKKEVEPFENDETKHCPFCDNVIKAKAIKCQYCGEFLDGRKKGKEKEISPKKEFKKSSNISESSAIKAGKATCRGYRIMFVRLGIAVLLGIADAEGMVNSDFYESGIFNALDMLIYFIPILLLMIWSNKTYGYLLRSNVKNLRFNSTGWPTWGWICPIACLYIPYQTVKDIYKTFNEKCGIIGWWWACYLISVLLMRATEYDDSGFSALLGLGVLIAEYILIMKILKNVNRSLEE